MEKGEALRSRRHCAGCFCYVILKAAWVFYYIVGGVGFALSQEEAGVTLQFLLPEPTAWTCLIMNVLY